MHCARRARSLLLPGEDPAEFERLFAGLEADWRPQNQTERLLVEQMAVAQWKLARLETGESSILEQTMTAEKQLALLDRFSVQRARLERSFSKAAHDLEHFRKTRPAKPEHNPGPRRPKGACPAASHEAAGANQRGHLATGPAGASDLATSLKTWPTSKAQYAAHSKCLYRSPQTGRHNHQPPATNHQPRRPKAAPVPCLTVEAANGAVKASGIRGGAHVRTSFGAVPLDEVAGALDVENQNGGVEASLQGQPCRPVAIRTSFSALRVRVPGDASYAVAAKTSFGKIRSDFPMTVSGEVGGDSLSGNIGGGACSMRLTNNNGSIEILKSGKS